MTWLELGYFHSFPVFLYVLLSFFVFKKVDPSQENVWRTSREAVIAAKDCGFADFSEVSEIPIYFSLPY